MDEDSECETEDSVDGWQASSDGTEKKESETVKESGKNTAMLAEDVSSVNFFTSTSCSSLVLAPSKLQALVYDILPSTTAVFSYAIGSRKLSTNEQFFVGAQTVVSLLQTTQIKQGVSFIAANKVYTSTNKTTIV